MTQGTVFDVTVIGAGTMGMAAGAFLAKQNVKTLLIDSFNPPHDHGSHHGGTRMIRHAYGEGVQYVKLVQRAQQLWAELEKQSGTKIFEKTGVLGLGPKDSVFLQETIEAARRYDLPLNVMSASDIVEKWPGIHVPSDFIGCYETESGLVYSENAVQAYKEMALKNGAKLLINSPVQQIEINSDELIRIKTERNEYLSKKVIVTVGAWAAKMLPSLKLPVQPVRKVVCWFETPEDLFNVGHFPSFYVDDVDKMFYGFPNINGTGLKLGRTDGGQPIDPDQHSQNFGAYESDEGELRDFLENYLPEANRKLNEGKTCLMTQSSDHHFIIDQHPENENVIIACGFSGHGFKFASVMGEVLSQLAVSGRTEHDISLFSLNRF
ncbi:N-methyltryptophan oxidase [Fictibacillus arsenicus]|jgi:N-methyl-L-tryptophan oxidase|uniref:N-methyltryptophan oxidase n=1 Tax=Fictibacillus arsenicus TaxID=255247 RepID=A0A1B1Z9G3_9BACL|nr:N-methyl-L-tryptophan oxidase [Fictibacillus arsenicus]ANX14076.1 N-methyltryptophan oxidase [Fictibacillus arsenicus]